MPITIKVEPPTWLPCEHETVRIVWDGFSFKIKPYGRFTSCDYRVPLTDPLCSDTKEIPSLFLTIGFVYQLSRKISYPLSTIHGLPRLTISFIVL